MTHKKHIVLLDLFSGAGGFHVGLHKAGYTFKKVYFSEIDKHAVANYKHNFPYAEYVGSVTDVHGRDLERPDIITFGSPCQDFSLAGKRSGMEGQRSVLILEAIRLITECQPSVFIWENVKGVFSSNGGADFWAILAAFANIGGYRLEWQLLNGSWFLPQNRERIYLVGHLAGRSEPGVFPFREEHFGSNERLPKTPSVACLSVGGHSGGGAFRDDADRSYPPPSRVTNYKGGESEGRGRTRDAQCNINGGNSTNDSAEPRKRSEHNDEPKINRIGGMYGQTTRWGVYDDGGLAPTITSAMGEGGGHIPMILDNE